tara:strand:+ start:385 stop:717 length:333 start_codon:yes stop_codon:yes gene_type:complete
VGFFGKLFGVNKKRTQAEETIRIMPDAIQFAAENWVYFNEAVPFAESTSLEEKYLAFMTPASGGLKNNFSALKDAPDEIFLVIVAKGIELSNTHSKQEIETALGVTLPLS